MTKWLDCTAQPEKPNGTVFFISVEHDGIVSLEAIRKSMENFFSRSFSLADIVVKEHEETK